MKTMILTLCLLCGSLLCAEDKAPVTAPVFPSELKLANGVTLHNATPTRWATDYVVVKHATGIDPIQYRYIAAEQRPIVVAVKAEADKAKKHPAAPVVAAPAAGNRTLEGQAFIVTAGAGSYKLGGMIIYEFPIDRFGLFDSNLTIDLGDPIATATTDADGKFKLVQPADTDFFLFARGERTTPAYRGSAHERYEWIVKSSEITDRSAVIFSNQNQHLPTRAVKIGAIVLDGLKTDVR